MLESERLDRPDQSPLVPPGDGFPYRAVTRGGFDRQDVGAQRHVVASTPPSGDAGSDGWERRVELALDWHQAVELRAVRRPSGRMQLGREYGSAIKQRKQLIQPTQ